MTLEQICKEMTEAGFINELFAGALVAVFTNSALSAEEALRESYNECVKDKTNNNE